MTGRYEYPPCMMAMAHALTCNLTLYIGGARPGGRGLNADAHTLALSVQHARLSHPHARHSHAGRRYLFNPSEAQAPAPRLGYWRHRQQPAGDSPC